MACGGAGVSAGAATFFDFMTMATMRCSSMRKARTILKINEIFYGYLRMKIFNYRRRTHLAHREPPYVRDTVFNLFVIPMRCLGRDALIYNL